VRVSNTGTVIKHRSEFTKTSHYKQEIRIFLRNIPITLHPNQAIWVTPPSRIPPRFTLRYCGERWLAAFNGLLTASSALIHNHANSSTCGGDHNGRHIQYDQRQQQTDEARDNVTNIT